MANKTYNQYCAVGHALDLIGERWTLLIIRNLLAGPKRFTDLKAGLPGISTNILSDRLKSLEEHTIIANRELPPPAASNVYELTDVGYGLIPVLTTLAQWGAQTLGAPRRDHAVVPECLIFMLLGILWTEEKPTVELYSNWHILDDVVNQKFGVRITPGGVEIEPIPLVSASIQITMGAELLLRLSSRQITLGELINTHQISIEGTETEINQLILLTTQ